MRSRSRNVIVAMAMCVVMGWSAKASAEDLIIYNVSVLVSTGWFTPEIVGWHFPVTLKPGETLTLAQNGSQCGLHGFCFDTSDFQDANGWAWIMITTNDGQFGFLDTSRILTTETGPGGPNESKPPTWRFATTRFWVRLAYVDTEMPREPWKPFPIGGTYVQATPSDYGTYDSGVIIITATE